MLLLLLLHMLLLMLVVSQVAAAAAAAPGADAASIRSSAVTSWCGLPLLALFLGLSHC